MSAEPIAAPPVDAVAPANNAEKGLLIAVLLVVLLGVTGMLFMV